MKDWSETDDEPDLDAGIDDAASMVGAIVDIEKKAAKVCYPSGRPYRRGKVDLRRRQIVIVLHQTAVVRGIRTFAGRAHRVKAHRTIGPDGTRFRVHPIDRVLWAANRLNYAPFHALNIEVSGNFAGSPDRDGNPNPKTYWHPEVFGCSVLSVRQRDAVRAEIRTLVDEVHDAGADVWAIAPHRISGKSKAGVPNRPLCPGFEIWSQCGEWAHEEMEIPIPESTFGGLAIPEAWRIGRIPP